MRTKKLVDAEACQELHISDQRGVDELTIRLLHKGESLCCFRNSASVTYGGVFPSDFTLSALSFSLFAESGQSCKQGCETVDFCNSLMMNLTNKIGDFL